LSSILSTGAILVAFALMIVTGPAVLHLGPWATVGNYDLLVWVTVLVEPYLLWIGYLTVRLMSPARIKGQEYLLVFAASWAAWLFLGFGTVSVIASLSTDPLFGGHGGLFGLVFFINVPWYAAQFLVLFVPLAGWLDSRGRV
jgi:hypothetical protein